MTLETLERHGIRTDGLSSKTWERFFGLGAPEFDFLIVVCDESQAELVGEASARMVTAFWPTPNPAGDSLKPEQMRIAFEAVYDSLQRQVCRFVDLPLATMSVVERRTALAEIGRHVSATPPAETVRS